MSFRAATESYESWLGSHLEIVPEDLDQKHELMKADIFSFFRATFYRWCQLWPEQCGECNAAPEILAVGDLHVENFGTWRDEEARLVWGINDFDEVTQMPYTIDLVRLAASAHLAIDAGHLNIAHHEACREILDGYRSSLEAGGQPWILAGKHPWLRELVVLRDSAAFWAKIEALEAWKGRIPKEARRGIDRLMPIPNLPLRFAHRVAGLGSLGRERFVGTANHFGSPVCREAKALAPSAWLWAQGKHQSSRIRYQEALDTSVRALDPFVRLKNSWIVRRLAPDCIRVELGNVAKDKEKDKLLRAMGWETANVHIGSKQTRALLKDLARRPNQWLHEAAARMVKATRADWDEWRGQQAEPKAPKSGKAKAPKSRRKKARSARAAGA
ncbi:MAG TPA: DUF2252 family protein [Bryobacteraceae bacterium]|nr:DUF2252 family protein [Bryobacteraceae bacterium]